MNLTHLDPVTLASLIGAGALALTRLLTTAKPLWDRLPASLQGLLPALVLVLPQIAEKAAGVKTSLDLVNLLVLAGALILPGFHSHTVGTVPPNGPGAVGAEKPEHIVLPNRDGNPSTPPTAAIRGVQPMLVAWALCLTLVVAMFLGTIGCSRLAKVDWSKFAACAEQPAESALTEIVSGVLAGTGDVQTELEGAAIEYGVPAVKCVVAQLVNDLSSAPVTARASRQATRGREFLAKVGR